MLLIYAFLDLMLANKLFFLINRPIIPIILDENYVYLKNQVIKSERRILKELGFCVHVKHPHKVNFSILDNK